jgi:hypothetical protein
MRAVVAIPERVVWGAVAWTPISYRSHLDREQIGDGSPFKGKNSFLTTALTPLHHQVSHGDNDNDQGDYGHPV